jgi:diguanylate cyclase (GGDEF)-like protein
VKLLLIENSDLDARDIVKMIAAGSDEGFTVRHVHSAASAMLALREKQRFDVILLDLSLPDSRGGDSVINLLQHHSATPFVALGGTGNMDVAVQALRLGVQDYLVKGHFDVDQLYRSIRYAIERKNIERKLEFLAGHDQLTGLINRQRLWAAAEHALSNADRQRTKVALLFVDLDHFKAVNDKWGHAAGDKVLVTVAHRMANAIRRGDTAARLGGDEFAVLLEAVPDSSAAEAVGAKIRESLAEPCVIDGQPYVVSASIGIAMFPDDGRDVRDLLGSADEAMYVAKARGRNASEVRELRSAVND